MKLVVLCCIVACAAMAITADIPCDEHFNADRFMDNFNELNKYLGCFHGDGFCFPRADNYKVFCSQCNKDEKQNFWIFLRLLKVFMKEEFNYFIQKYDPKNVYSKEMASQFSQIDSALNKS